MNRRRIALYGLRVWARQGELEGNWRWMMTAGNHLGVKCNEYQRGCKLVGQKIAEAWHEVALKYDQYPSRNLP